MKIHHKNILTFITITHYCSFAQIFEPLQPVYYVKRHLSAELVCKAKNASKIQFYCNGRKSKNRYTRIFQEDDGTLTGRLLVNVEQLDNYFGNKDFSCECNVNKNQYISTTIIKKPFLRRNFVQEPGDKNIEHQSEVELYCKPPKGDPPPKVYWKFNGKILDTKRQGFAKYYLQTRNGLILRNADIEIGGLYTCVAENLAEIRKSVDAKITVYRWEEWQAWGQCHLEVGECGIGNRERKRYCQASEKNPGSSCQGGNREIEDCDVDCLSEYDYDGDSENDFDEDDEFEDYDEDIEEYEHEEVSEVEQTSVLTEKTNHFPKIKNSGYRRYTIIMWGSLFVSLMLLICVLIATIWICNKRNTMFQSGTEIRNIPQQPQNHQNSQNPQNLTLQNQNSRQNTILHTTHGQQQQQQHQVTNLLQDRENDFPATIPDMDSVHYRKNPDESIFAKSLSYYSLINSVTSDTCCTKYRNHKTRINNKKVPFHYSMYSRINYPESKASFEPSIGRIDEDETLTSENTLSEESETSERNSTPENNDEIESNQRDSGVISSFEMLDSNDSDLKQQLDLIGLTKDCIRKQVINKSGGMISLDGYGVKAVFPDGCLEKSTEIFMAIIHRAIFRMNMVARESICGPIVVQMF